AVVDAEADRADRGTRPASEVERETRAPDGLLQAFQQVPVAADHRHEYRVGEVVAVRQWHDARAVQTAGGLEVADQAPRLVGTHAEPQPEELGEVVGASQPACRGEEPDDAALGRRLLGLPAHEPAARAPRLKRPGEPQHQGGGHDAAALSSTQAPTAATSSSRVTCSPVP